MYVCHCMGVSDSTVRVAVAKGDRTIDELARSCGAGSGCGACHPVLADLLDGPDRDLVPSCAAA